MLVYLMHLQFVQWLFSIETIVKPLPPATAYNISPKPELLHPHLVRSSSVGFYPLTYRMEANLTDLSFTKIVGLFVYVAGAWGPLTN